LNCEGYEVDNEKFNAVMNDIVSDLKPLTQEGQNNLPVDTVMAGYSTALGGQLAIAAYDKDVYCASAAALREELKEDTEGKLAIWKTKD
jgi:hypothetical protein